MIQLLTAVRTALARLAPSRASGDPPPSGWIRGRFPAALRTAALHGQRDYFLYVPLTASRRQRAPLVVMLHGCSQDALAFAQGTRMNELADEHGFLVLYPQQSPRGNALRCWNWFDRLTLRGHGEAAAIASLVERVARRYRVDRSRIYIAGISAGGAMTAILAIRHGSLFAACAIVSGVMYGAADSALLAMRAMRSGASVSPEGVAEDAARTRSRTLRFVPALVVHGTHDQVVHARNAEQIVRQLVRFAEVLGTPADLLTDTLHEGVGSGVRSYRLREYGRGGQLLLRSILIDGLGHAWSGGDERLRFNDPALPDTTRLIWEFFHDFRRTAAQRPPRLRLWWRKVARFLRIGPT
ncbi:MAG: PHB depolymerase family esterase [Gammaproteobacteria bacterium]|nr:PHB depolymerase family esterase [Gammaproteobacteria bacterium]MBV8405916.1 PHB depolymerase family esterase [Gammaproteobacteria bacterium]